ncbi:hypothetical protein LXL04_038984 [Taraxacum kok-saghyz]
MNLTSLARVSFLSTSFTSRALNRSLAYRPISCSSLSHTPTSLNPNLPLFLRPPTFTATVSDWLIEDTLESPKSLLLSEHDAVLKLRAELGDLYSRPFWHIVGCEHCVETELIIDLVDDAIKQNVELKNGMWVDLGTGSGALAVGIGRILGDSGRITAIDLSLVAVQVASFNVNRYNLQFDFLFGFRLTKGKGYRGLSFHGQGFKGRVDRQEEAADRPQSICRADLLIFEFTVSKLALCCSELFRVDRQSSRYELKENSEIGNHGRVPPYRTLAVSVRLSNNGSAR